MSALSPPNPIEFRGLAAKIFELVSLNIRPGDGMFQGDSWHYLTCGASAFNVISAAASLAQVEPKTFLDFGSGAGRVTRWLRAGYPAADIAATDIRPQDLDFCAQEFGAKTWVSGTNVDKLASPSLYDVIWVGSVLTHLSGVNSDRLVRKLFSWLQPNGVLVASFHGRFAHSRGPEFGYYGIGNKWSELENQYISSGYGYADYPGQKGYGISITKPSWCAALVERVPNARIILLSERAWDNHHDVLALQNKPITAPL